MTAPTIAPTAAPVAPATSTGVASSQAEHVTWPTRSPRPPPNSVPTRAPRAAARPAGPATGPAGKASAGRSGVVPARAVHWLRGREIGDMLSLWPCEADGPPLKRAAAANVVHANR